MLIQWQPAHSYSRFPPSLHNFGDHLPTLFEAFFEPAEWRRLIDDPVNGYCFLGSTLCNGEFNHLLGRKLNPHYLCCGYRGEALDPELVALVNIYGCRGYLSQRALKDAGEYIDVVGDPAALLPMLIAKPTTKTGRLLMPHVLDLKLGSYQAADHGCDRVLSPLTSDVANLTQMIQDIASADFVLAGAMHAAIVAHSYGVPFAFFETDYRDCPKKWEDWGSSVGLKASDIQFFQNEADGRQWYEKVKMNLRRMPMLPILFQIARVARVRREWFEKAWQLDMDSLASPNVQR